MSQRRHKNAIPIMAPPERSNKNAHNRSSGSGQNVAGNNDSNNNTDQQQVKIHSKFQLKKKKS